MLLTDWGQASSLLLICSLIYPAACGRSELAYAAPSAGRWRYMVWVQSHCFGYPEHTPLHCCVFCSVFSKQAALRVQWLRHPDLFKARRRPCVCVLVVRRRKVSADCAAWTTFSSSGTHLFVAGA